MLTTFTHTPAARAFRSSRRDMAFCVQNPCHSFPALESPELFEHPCSRLQKKMIPIAEEAIYEAVKRLVNVVMAAHMVSLSLSQSGGVEGSESQPSLLLFCQDPSKPDFAPASCPPPQVLPPPGNTEAEPCPVQGRDAYLHPHQLQ